jgi:hypothetical protein
MLIVGNPGVGKTSLILNIIVEQTPKFTEIYLIHLDCEHTKEYDRLQPTGKMNDIPSIDFWNDVCERSPAAKRLVILDDLEFQKCGPERLRHLAQLMRYVSTHKGMSVLISSQSYFDLPPILRKMSNMLAIYKPNSLSELTCIGNRIGYTKEQMDELFDKYSGPRDFITVDLSIGSPYPLRFGLAEPIAKPIARRRKARPPLEGFD